MTKPKRKLIFCWPYLEWGGAQVYFMAIMKFARAEWDVRAVLPAESSVDVKRFLDEIDVPYDTLDFYLDLSPARGLAAKLKRQLKRIRVELGLLAFLRRFDLRDSILHIETSPWQSWIFLTLLSLRGANVFVTMHNAISGPAWRKLIWKARMRFVTRLPGFSLFVSNEDTKRRIRPWASREFWERIPVTYTCVDPVQIEQIRSTSLDREARRAEFGIAKDDMVVLCVGQFIDRKGRWEFIEAAKIIRPEVPNVKFVWLTPLPPSAEDQKRLDEIVPENFHLILSAKVGCTREEVLNFFRIADIFALPSFVEGLPIALLEAMALSLPAISTNVYAIPEAVFDNRTGLLIEPGDARALAGAVARLAADPDLRNRLGREGSDFVLCNFDDRVASAIAVDAYERCFDD